ncbi:MAG: FAD-dependent oxidoreductase [Nitrososphaeria archaeon]
MEKIVVVGGGIAGTIAAMTAKKESSKTPVSLITEERYAAYSRCGLPYLISGEVKRWEHLLIYNEETLRNQTMIDLKLSTYVKKIDTSNRRIIISELNEYSKTLEYTKLIIATGATAIKPSIVGINLKNVFEIRNLNDSLKIKEAAQSKGKAIIVGGGLVCLETAEALRRTGVKVTIVSQEKEILSMVFDEEIGKLVRRRLEEHKVEVIEASKLEYIYGTRKVEAVKVNGRILPCSILVMALGVKPNSSLALEAGIPTGKYGGIIVNDKMETKIQDIYAAGDCTEIYNFITNEYMPIQLATIAHREGEIAGGNSVGGNKGIGKVVSNSCTKIFGLELATVGITLKEADRMGIKAYDIFIKSSNKIDYFPRKKSVWTYLIFDSKTNRLIGAQLAGERASTWGNFAALAILQGLNVDDLANFSNSYSPSVENFWAGLVVAAKKVRELKTII